MRTATLICLFGENSYFISIRSGFQTDDGILSCRWSCTLHRLHFAEIVSAKKFQPSWRWVDDERGRRRLIKSRNLEMIFRKKKFFDVGSKFGWVAFLSFVWVQQLRKQPEQIKDCLLVEIFFIWSYHFQAFYLHFALNFTCFCPGSIAKNLIFNWRSRLNSLRYINRDTTNEERRQQKPSTQWQ